MWVGLFNTRCLGYKPTTDLRDREETRLFKVSGAPTTHDKAGSLTCPVYRTDTGWGHLSVKNSYTGSAVKCFNTELNPLAGFQDTRLFSYLLHCSSTTFKCGARHLTERQLIEYEQTFDLFDYLFGLCMVTVSQSLVRI